MKLEARIPRILLAGMDGQLGFELQRSLAVLGAVSAIGRRDCDLTQPEQIRQVLQKLQPDINVNAAAYTAVDKAESDQRRAGAGGARAPRAGAAGAGGGGARGGRF